MSEELKPGHLPMDVPPNHCCKCGYLMSDIVVTCEVCGKSQPAHTSPSPVDSVGVDIMVRVKAECTKHQKGVGATGCNSCPLAGEGFNCVLDGPASHWNMPAMEAALADSTPAEQDTPTPQEGGNE